MPPAAADDHLKIIFFSTFNAIHLYRWITHTNIYNLFPLFSTSFLVPNFLIIRKVRM